MTPVKIDIVSDIACPWCAIGYARLEEAMRQLEGEMEFQVEWHAFELNPDPSAEGEPILEALSRKYGRSEEEMEGIQSQMQEIAQGLGLDFSALQERHTRNTFDGHRLVKWAAEAGLQTPMKKALFTAHFGQDAKISDPQVLAELAQTVGLDAQAAEEILAGDAYSQAVRDDEARWQEAGVSSVPAYIINQRYLISGAQEPQTLVKALQDISQETAAD
ncbi:DsbA family oxidoreductase [Marinospirillum perlucidum]|uniref:DsbA family oxidoreductase n=1 Tax=Marinospirillum perlucidum TaxID=1982602 RepID=UPI000DF18E15|nr:DsbA family oxidoreductase [Marinospirillum perlucidum]